MQTWKFVICFLVVEAAYLSGFVQLFLRVADSQVPYLLLAFGFVQFAFIVLVSWMVERVRNRDRSRITIERESRRRSAMLGRWTAALILAIRMAVGVQRLITGSWSWGLALQLAAWCFVALGTFYWLHAGSEDSAPGELDPE